MTNKRLPPLLLCISLLGACAATGPADDGFENSNEWVNNGRLLSDESKILYKSKPKQSSPVKGTDQTSSVALKEKDEFEQFKQWNKLREAGTQSKEYAEFLQWLKFQDFKSGQ